MSKSREIQLAETEALDRMVRDESFRDLSQRWFAESFRYKYPYHFTWMGRPIIQYPQDLVAMQEIIWSVQPDVIIETGIAHGGSLVFYASMLELLGGDRLIVGIDVEIRPQNRAAIETHPLFRRIRLIEGSSVDPQVARRATQLTAGRCVLVILDSNHTHDHVLTELKLYSPLVSIGSYLVVFDTVVDHLPDALFVDRPWRKGNSPKSAVHEFLRSTDCFAIDRAVHDKLAITSAPDGYLRRIKA